MNNKLNVKNTAALAGFWIACAAVMYLILQKNYSFHFFFIEQSKLFVQTTEYFKDSIREIGGLNVWIADFLTQYFIVPYRGPAIVTVILILTSVTFGSVLRKISGDWRLYPIALLPSVVQFFLLLEFNYYLEGSTGVLFAILALAAYVSIKNVFVRLGVCVIFPWLLYFFIGPPAVLWSVCVVIWEATKRERFWMCSFLCPAFVLLSGLIAVRYSMVGEFKFALLPDFSYNQLLNPKKFIYYSWGSVPLLMIMAYLTKKSDKTEAISRKKLTLFYSVQALFLGCCIYIWAGEYGKDTSAKVKEFDYYIRTEQWNKIIDQCRGKLDNYLYKCQLNLALAKTGRLANDAFRFDQKGVSGLLPQWNKVEIVSCLLSDIYYNMGATHIAQQMAFEAYQSGRGIGNGRMIKRLVQTNLIYGAYPVAEKYINLLENTFYYKDWAKSQRKFLYDDLAVEYDPEYGARRKALPDSSNLAQITVFHDLKNFAVQNPSFKSPIEYLGTALLLEKELNGFEALLERFYGTDVLPVLPKSFQEAVCVLNEKDMDYWNKYGLPESMQRRFIDYKKSVLANKNNAGAANMLYMSFGDTYWYYYMYKK